MGVADEDLLIQVDHRPDGVRLHRLALEVHLPEIDGVTWAKVRTAYLAATNDAGREAAMAQGWGAEGRRFYVSLGHADGVFGLLAPGRKKLRQRLSDLFSAQAGGGEAPPPKGSASATSKRR